MGTRPRFAKAGDGVLLECKTQKLLDDLDPGDVVEVEFLEGDRHRWTIGPYSHLEKDPAFDGE